MLMRPYLYSTIPNSASNIWIVWGALETPGRGSLGGGAGRGAGGALCSCSSEASCSDGRWLLQVRPCARAPLHLYDS
jgi:hypothetical protein